MESAPKRKKTFTGCWTCRERKVKCDLRKPECYRCEKSGFQCTGYDIKLRWSNPVRFDKYGYQLSTTNGNNNTNQGNGNGGPAKDEQYFQRRSVKFVKYRDEYKTYDEMERHLLYLHNNSTLNLNDTKTMGPFGVFRGKENAKKRRPYVSKAKRKSKLAKSDVVRGNTTTGAATNGASNAAATNGLVKDPYPDINFFNLAPNMTQGNEWLSKDLIDDALLTVSALNGDTHFLDFFNVNENGSSSVLDQQLGLNNHHQTRHHASGHSQAHSQPQPLQPVPTQQNSNSRTQFSPVFQPDLLNLQLLTPISLTQDELSSTTNLQQQQQQHQQNQDEMFNLLFHRNSQFDKQFPLLTPQPVKRFLQPRFKLNANNELHSIASPSSGEELSETTPSPGREGVTAATIPTESTINSSTSSSADDSYNRITIDAPDGSCKMPSLIMEVVPWATRIPEALQIDNFPISSVSLHVNPMTRYLLNYYIEEVADMMTVIPLPKNPWKFIYFPRLVMAVGELGSVGKTSNARNCLLNLLLAVSAFNLQSKFNRNSDEMKYYLNLGIQLRQQLTIFLKNCLLDDVMNQKYKDVLVAVLSMVTVDMVWGTMSDCKLHLDICEKFIGKKMETKKKLSSKALILHRIFSNLKLIQDSTSLDNIKKEEIYLNDENYTDFLIDHKRSPEEYKSPSVVPTKGVFHEKINDRGKIRIEYIVNAEEGEDDVLDNEETSARGEENDDERKDRPDQDDERRDLPMKKKSNIPAFIDITRNSFRPSKNKLNDHEISSDAFYGLPNSLILLFSEIVHLVRFKKYHEDNKIEIPSFFNKLLEEIEVKLQNWTLEWKLYEEDGELVAKKNNKSNDGHDDFLDKKFLTKRHEGIYHHVLSFYHGLVIYFKRLVKEVNPMYLQEHVEKVLIHLNLIQLITENRTRDNKDLLIIPLFWQGFIAGSELMTYFLQTGFKDWGTNISKSGIGSYWVLRQIMLEVWRRKNTNEKRNTWCDVIKDWEMNVMLS